MDLTEWPHLEAVTDCRYFDQKAGYCSHYGCGCLGKYLCECLVLRKEDVIQAKVKRIEKNQLSRRNLTPEQISLLRGRRYNRQVRKQGAPKGNSNASKQSRQNDDIVSGRLSAQLGTEYGVSRSTIERDGRDAKTIDQYPDQVSLIIGRRYERTKKQGERTDLTSGQNVQKSTSATIAAEYGLNEKTVRRYG